jgi:predicted secreted hydrolase
MTIRRLVIIAAVAGLVTFWAAGRLAQRSEPARSSGLSVVDVLAGSDTAGFARALEPRPFVFPADHGPHPDFRTEWWYVTANLEGALGDRFGVQLTIFRSALAPEGPSAVSDWTTNQAYMGHFAVTDVSADRFSAFERFARGAQGLAGAQSDPPRAWLEDWEIEAIDDDAFRIRASQPGLAVELVLRSSKALVLQGEEGLSQKGPGAGNASYYYSFTRMEAEGVVRRDGRETAVEGSAWLDREWSTSALAAGQVGWDWFALQLDDGRDLMVYRMRRADGTADAYSKGVLVGTRGEPTPLDLEDIDLTVEERWTSPSTGVTYPASWSLAVPSAGLALRIQPVRSDQELDVTFRYWEGAVDVEGRAHGEPVSGVGYVELTGYGAEIGSRVDVARGRRITEEPGG